MWSVIAIGLAVTGVLAVIGLVFISVARILIPTLVLVVAGVIGLSVIVLVGGMVAKVVMGN